MTYSLYKLNYYAACTGISSLKCPCCEEKLVLKHWKWLCVKKEHSGSKWMVLSINSRLNQFRQQQTYKYKYD